MGDRAYAEIVCREDDAPSFQAIGFMEEFRPGLPGNVLAMVDAEASNGNCSELQVLAERGIIFRGGHDAGDSRHSSFAPATANSGFAHCQVTRGLSVRRPSM